jgi:MFS family permease
VAGLGGLLYGVDVGIIGGALPYLAATSGLNASQLSIVAAVLLGSVISTLFTGMISDWVGRKPLMVLSGTTFVISIPVIALSRGYGPLFLGRLLQGISGGVIGVIVPLYLAECLSATRGKGTGVFQWLLTLGIVAAALIGIYFSYRIVDVTANPSAATIFAIKDEAWRRIFGFHFRRVSCSLSAVSWSRSRHAGYSAAGEHWPPVARFCAHALRKKRI